MASGEVVVQVIKVLPPGANYATLDVREGGSTPAEEVVVYDFDDTTIEYLDFLCYLAGYDGGGLTFTLPWSATSATSGTIQLEAAIRALPDDAEDIDAAHTYLFNFVVDTAPSASGEIVYPVIIFTDGADMDSWADGELAIVRVRRNTGGTDTMTGDAELWTPVGKET